MYLASFPTIGATGPSANAPLASNQPYCARYNILPPVPSYPETALGILRMEIGSLVHDLMQQFWAANYTCFGDWECPTCKEKWTLGTRPEHEHPIRYCEHKYNIPVVDRNTKPDMILWDSDKGRWKLVELKVVQAIPPKPSRSYWLQANLTTHIANLYLPFQIKEFEIYFLTRSLVDEDRKIEEKVYPYNYDPEVAKIQLSLMKPKCDEGICACPGDWYCDKQKDCFKDGKQGRLFAANPKRAEELFRLRWPKEEYF